MIGRVAFDLVLGIAFRGVMHMTFVVEVRGVKSDNRPRHAARLGIPAYMIADFELFSHLAESSFLPASAFFNTVPSLCLSCLAQPHRNSGHGRTAEIGPDIEVGDRLETVIEAVASPSAGFGFDH